MKCFAQLSMKNQLTVSFPLTSEEGKEAFKEFQKIVEEIQEARKKGKYYFSGDIYVNPDEIVCMRAVAEEPKEESNYEAISLETESN